MKKRYDTEVELLASSGGVFEVAIDGRLIFSKKKLGRFPEDEELFGLIADGAAD